MSRTRLPRPGEVLEHCRLCGAVLEVSVANPRRSCAACGELNLPDALVPATRGVVRSPSTTLTLREVRTMLLLGAATPLAALGSCALFAWLAGTSRAGSVDWALPFLWVLGPLALASAAGCLWRMTRPGARPVAAALSWVAGMIGGVGLSAAIAYGSALVSWLWPR